MILKVAKEELDLGKTLKCGQSFGWKRVERGGREKWKGVIGNHLFTLEMQPDGLKVTTTWCCFSSFILLISI